MRRLLNHPALTFVALLAWKVALLVFTTQPIPSNDSYFYDGAVVNSLHGGAFVNPTVAIARPYSGTEFFSAYPPLYQAVLYGWMSVCGTSAASATGLHVVLVLTFALLVYSILRRLDVETWMMHLAGGFLFALTFHDRPDTLAHVWGAGAALLTVGWQRNANLRHLWGTAVFLALVFLTSLQLGATYAVVIGVTVLAQALITKERIPWSPLVAMGLTPFVLLAVGKFGFPRWWIGFVENSTNNPSTVGLHFPDVDSLLKLGRSLPGFLAVLLLVLWSLPRIKAIVSNVSLSKTSASQLALFLGALAGSLGVCVMGLTYLSPNYIPAFGGYLQPLVVGVGLAWLTREKLLGVPKFIVIGLGCICVAVGGLRAAGMSTWALLCARDVSYADTTTMISQELKAASASESKTVIASSAYLYAAATHRDIKLIHSDHLVLLLGRNTEPDLVGLLALKPSRMLLTQFDYYRRYETVLAELRRTRGDVDVRIINTARVQPPDAERTTRKVIQHIAWAPVIVEFTWPSNPETK